MDSLQLKVEIKKVIDQMPENALPSILDYLKELQNKPDESLQLSMFMKLTLFEDKELLEKLAQ